MDEENVGFAKLEIKIIHKSWKIKEKLQNNANQIIIDVQSKTLEN